MKKLSLYNIIKKDSANFREDIKIIETHLASNEEIFELDFTNIRTISPSSAHEITCILRKHKNLKLSGMNEKIIKILAAQIRTRQIPLTLSNYFLEQSHQAQA
ncbi:hypothetical protein H6501_05165 [Candidatus Woesearchaeota archaeon]|nr:hypothetical protein [Nanoarchaeota archaeon]MCB9370963.1 hypothetical protein [Candidatus Woesearchaeota archaeon]USN44065.1 MAG: hypothetical protein H6500_06780 [Candidatus Woesearchaeota archaeon]